MNERQASEVDVQVGKIKKTQLKSDTKRADADEKRHPSPAKRRTRSTKSFWSRLNPPQATVLAGIIAALVSLIGAGISIWSTFYKKELANYDVVLQRNKEREDKTLLAYDEAIKAIRHMKNTIQVVIADKAITIDDAKKSLRGASGKLDEAYGNNGSAIMASDYTLSRVFHDTKSSGRRAWSNLEGQNGQTSSKLSASEIEGLKSIVDELTSAEGQLQEKYNSLIVR
jgi:hypothetical protein